MGGKHPNFDPLQAQDLFNLTDRTIILTGGLGGMGLSLTKTLLLYGADIVCFDTAGFPENSQWGPLLDVANQTGRKLSYFHCDVTNLESVTTAFEQAEPVCRYPLRGLVALAGISGRSSALEYNIDAFRKIMEVNVTGTFLCAQAAARIMRKNHVGGSIVLFASISGTVVNQGVDTVAYNTSKSAVLQMARSLAAEWGQGRDEGGAHNYPPIRVNTISPGYIMTPMTMPTARQGLQELWESGNMLGRLSTVEEHQASVVYLLADGSSYVTASDLRADGGHCAW